MHPNTTKRTETLVQGLMWWIGCIRCKKIPTWHCGTNFCNNCTSSPHFAPSFMQLRNDPNSPKHYATHQNMRSGSNGVDWVRSLRKIPTWLRGTNFCINCIVHTVLYRVSCSYETISNGPKHYATHQNMSLGSNGVNWLRSFQKILMWLRGSMFFIEFHAVTKRSQMHPNTMRCTKTLV